MPRKTQSASSLLTGDDLRQMFIVARSSLELNVSSINALNVFPVPDGDTGTNMLLTLKAVDEGLAGLESAGAGVLAQAIARGTLMGARGNSGVILSQFFHGWAQGLAGVDTFGGREMARALQRAADASYKAVANPVEGTILTVVKEAARGAGEAAAGGELNPVVVWERACQAARKALAETPDLLPVLKEAGVVDAGGLGLVAIMEGMRCYLCGEEVSPLNVDIGRVSPTAVYLTATEDKEYGYCTQFLLQGSGLDVDTMRGRMAAMADSTVVVGDTTAIKVHAHTYDPGALISYAVSVGSITQVKIDNIDRQHQEFLEGHRERQRAQVPLGVVAVAAGDGILQVLRGLGAVDIVPGGQTMNPSVKDIVDHVAQATAAQVILLPNNPNIVGTAQQAASVSPKPLHVVPTRSIPQGVAALLAFNPDLDAATNLARMQEAAAGVRSGEVTRAVRATSVGGVSVRQGDAIAMLDDKLVAAAATSLEALEKLCLGAAPAHGALITLYWGGSTQEQEAQEAADRLRSCCPGVEVEVVHGGQPHYDYLVSIE
ncbi:MAG: DAK2 domain-containing protein [Dehalococcoidia bacterium]|nr:DAK2 domain-containing protein [Dehalococcoidia bacterium]